MGWQSPFILTLNVNAFARIPMANIPHCLGLSFVSIVTLSSMGTVFVPPSTIRAEMISATNEQSVIEGTFVEVAHDTIGTAKILVEDGVSYVKFDDAFKTDDGPDLFVLLHRDAVPETYKPDDYLNLGELQAIRGTQRYEIPDGTDIAEYASVVIWCREFDVTFGYATLLEPEDMGDSESSGATPVEIEIVEDEIPIEPSKSLF